MEKIKETLEEKQIGANYNEIDEKKIKDWSATSTPIAILENAFDYLSISGNKCYMRLLSKLNSDVQSKLESTFASYKGTISYNELQMIFWEHGLDISLWYGNIIEMYVLLVHAKGKKYGYRVIDYDSKSNNTQVVHIKTFIRKYALGPQQRIRMFNTEHLYFAGQSQNWKTTIE